MMRRLLIVAVLLAACSGPEAQPDAAPAAAADDSATACEQFTREGLKLSAKTRAELEAEAGRPLQTNVSVEPNRHMPTEQDSIIQLEYDGMMVQLRKPGPGGELFEYVAVTKRKWLNFPFFRPGVEAERVVQAMGQPQRRAENRLVYNCGESEADEPVVFELDGGKVKRIVFNYYVD